MSERIEEIREQAEGLTNLCPEYLRMVIRHVQRNCDFECSAHPDDAETDECNQPDRYDGERMAKALADIPFLLDEVERLEREKAEGVVHVHHHDIEKHAEHFNEGYEAAMAQNLADDPSLAEDWLNAKLAEAWDEGHRVGMSGWLESVNPYREEET